MTSPKPKINYLYPPGVLLAVIVLASIWLWAHFLVLPSIDPPVDYSLDANGVADLEAHDWSESVSLLSPWEFYWQKTLSPESFERGEAPPPDCHLVPAYWAGNRCGPFELESKGRATYRLRVKVKSDAQGFAFHLMRAFMNFRIYVNGKLIHSQDPGSRAALDSPSFGAGEPELDIVLQVENYEFMYGGVYSRIRLGRAEQVAHERFLARATEIGIGACFFIMALYHFAFFCLRRRSIELLLFAAICSLILWRIAFVGQGTYFDLMHQARSEKLVLWVMYMSYYAALPAFAMFIYALFPKDFSKKLMLAVVGLSALALLSLVTLPMSVWMYTAPPYQILTAAYVAYAYFQIGRILVVDHREGAFLFGLGGSIVSLGLLYDIGALAFNFKTYDNVATLGLFCYLFVQALVLAIRFSRAFQLVEEGERDIKRLNMDLQEHERARTAMFHNTSHELRTPLNGILGFVRLIHNGQYGEIGEKPRAQLLKVESLARSLLNQVNTILDLAKSRQGSLRLAPTLFSLNELIYEVSCLSEALQTRQQQVGFELLTSWRPEEAPVFKGDQEKILTIVRNLLSNAFKFSKRDQAHRVKIEFILVNSDHLRVRIEDSGIGIPSEYLNKIFDEFRQVDDTAHRSYEGSGLGLAITRSFVSLMQGTIEVSSELGVGSVFEVDIPAAYASSEQGEVRTLVPSHSQSALPSPGRAQTSGKTSFLFDVAGDLPSPQRSRSLPSMQQHKILVVDDNPINCEVIKDILEAQGYLVRVALGGSEGLQEIELWQPDLVLLDLMMPVVSGEDVLQKLREHQALAQTPVILITARASQEDRIHGLSLGADDYLAKPIMSEEMILRVRNSLNRLELTHKAAEKAAIEQDLAAVQMINESISQSLVETPFYSFASFYQPAELTGGDWLGAFHDHEKQRVYFMIGDVTGHGMKSALVAVIVAAAIKGGIEVLQRMAGKESPEACLMVIRDAANRLMCDVADKLDKSMTMAFLSLDLETGEGCYLNAGHPPVCIIRKSEVTTLQQRVGPLGYDTDFSKLTPVSFHLGGGESLLMYTDGLTENLGPEGQRLRLARVFKKIEGEASASELKKLLVGEFEAVIRNRKAEDDCCFFVISRATPASTAPSTFEAAS